MNKRVLSILPFIAALGIFLLKALPDIQLKRALGKELAASGINEELTSKVQAPVLKNWIELYREFQEQGKAPLISGIETKSDKVMEGHVFKRTEVSFIGVYGDLIRLLYEMEGYAARSFIEQYSIRPDRNELQILTVVLCERED